MAITAEQTAALDELSDLVKRLENLEADVRIFVETWDGRNYDNAIDVVDVTDRHNFSDVQKNNAVDYLGHLTDFLVGNAVSTIDRWDVLAKVKKISA